MLSWRMMRQTNLLIHSWTFIRNPIDKPGRKTRNRRRKIRSKSLWTFLRILKHQISQLMCRMSQLQSAQVCILCRAPRTGGTPEKISPGKVSGTLRKVHPGVRPRAKRQVAKKEENLFGLKDHCNRSCRMRAKADIWIWTSIWTLRDHARRLIWRRQLAYRRSHSRWRGMSSSIWRRLTRLTRDSHRLWEIRSRWSRFSNQPYNNSWSSSTKGTSMMKFKIRMK